MERPIGLAQVGVGYWGKNLLRNLVSLPDARLLQVCDQRSDLLARAASLAPGAAGTPHFDEILANPEVDAVVIATQTDQHFPMASAALRAGKHVFVEKPMTHTLEEAEELVAIAEGEGLQVMVGHLLLYHPAFAYVENLIRNGTLGEIYYLYSIRVNLGIVRQSENALESLGPHDLAVALQFLGERPVAVSAQGHAYLQPGIQDVAFASIYFADGKMAHLHTSWLDPHKIRKVTVVGSRQMAVIDDVQESEKVRLYDKGVSMPPGEGRVVDYADAMRVRSGDIHIPKIEMKEPLRLECEHFVSCVREGKRPRSDARQGLDVIRILDAARRSIQHRGASVDIE